MITVPPVGTIGFWAIHVYLLLMLAEIPPPASVSRLELEARSSCRAEAKSQSWEGGVSLNVLWKYSKYKIWIVVLKIRLSLNPDRSTSRHFLHISDQIYALPNADSPEVEKQRHMYTMTDDVPMMTSLPTPGRRDRTDRVRERDLWTSWMPDKQFCNAQYANYTLDLSYIYFFHNLRMNTPTWSANSAL